MGINKMSKTTVIYVLVLVSLMTFVLLKFPVANVIWMKEGEIVRLLNYHNDTNITLVELIDVAGGNNRTKLCGFDVDGDQTWIEEGHDRELGGVRIYVRRIVLGRDMLENSDYCKVTFTKPIIKFNGSAVPSQSNTNLSDEEVVLRENLGAGDEESNLSALPSGGNDYNIVEDSMASEEETAEKTIEKPEAIGFFSRIMRWLKSLFE